MFQSFSSRGWVARELRNVHIDDYVEFVDDVRHVHLDELDVGPAVEDMVSFLSSCPELSRWEYTWDLFELCCLCLGHVSIKLPDVSLGSSKVGVTSVDLSSVTESIQGYLLSGDSEGNFFTEPESFSSGMELLETFCDRALQSDYNLWESGNVHGYQKIRSELEMSSAVRVAGYVESSFSLSEAVFVPEKLQPSNVVVLHSVHVLTLGKRIIVLWLSCWLGNCNRSVKLLMQSRLEFRIELSDCTLFVNVLYFVDMEYLHGFTPKEKKN